MPKTVVIIPCYNEAERLPQEDFVDAFESYPNLTFLFVNDGSSDYTLDILKIWEGIYPNVIALDKQPNSGKANAVRYAMLHADKNLEFDYIAYFDADLATPIYEIENFQKYFESNDEIMMVIGSRIRRMGANIDRKWKRHFIGRVFATFASATLALPIYDTQCGAKMLKKELINELFEKEFISKWLFDVEVLARLSIREGFPKIETSLYEKPLNEWLEKGDSRIKLKDFFKFPLDLFKIHRKYHRKIRKLKRNSK